jgi:L-threonylcarbamoyladenylate synthase
MPSPKIFKEISGEIKEGVDYVVTYRQDDEIIAEPSSLIKWDNGSVTILRS